MISMTMNPKFIIPLIVITLLLTCLYSVSTLLLDEDSGIVVDKSRPFYMQQY